jgi:hypothetical protein
MCCDGARLLEFFEANRATVRLVAVIGGLEVGHEAFAAGKGFAAMLVSEKLF